MRALNRLTARTIEVLRDPGRYGDGGGLWLQIAPGGSRSWLYRYMIERRARMMGLGGYPDVSLAEARTLALALRKQVALGVDPLAARAAEKARQQLAAARAMTFKACAEAYLAAHEAGWKNDKHRYQWRQTLEHYAYPILGDIAVATVDTPLVVKVIEPLWQDRTETASRLRGRIEVVLDWARVRGFREGENPARWKGHLDMLLPKRSRVRKVVHHAALPYTQVPAFMAELAGREGVAAQALRFTILTAARTGEVIGARWEEFVLAPKAHGAALWTLAPARMKMAREHRVPLSAPAVAILQDLAAGGEPQTPWVFPGASGHKPLSNMAMAVLLGRMGREDLTVHGFRSCFRDWAAECTGFPREVAEAALAHSIGDKVEAAYRRGDLFAKRRQLMDAWARYCLTPLGSGTVAPNGQGVRAADD